MYGETLPERRAVTTVTSQTDHKMNFYRDLQKIFASFQGPKLNDVSPWRMDGKGTGISRSNAHELLKKSAWEIHFVVSVNGRERSAVALGMLSGDTSELATIRPKRSLKTSRYAV